MFQDVLVTMILFVLNLISFNKILGVNTMFYVKYLLVTLIMHIKYDGSAAVMTRTTWHQQ